MIRRTLELNRCLVRDESDYDSQVLDLIDALALAEIGSPASREWFAALYMSEFAVPAPTLCDIYKLERARYRAAREKLMFDLADRNRKWSRRVYAANYNLAQEPRKS